MTTSTQTTPVPVDADLSCVGCGYNLRTLGETGNCPECGRGVGESLAAVRGHVDERVRRLLVRAAEMFLLAALASAATSFWPTFNAFAEEPGKGTAARIALWSAALLPPVASWWAAVLVSRGLGVGRTRRIPRRLVGFALVLAASVSTIGPVLILAVPFEWRRYYYGQDDQLLLAFAVSAAAVTLISFLWFASVARAARRRRLAWQCVVLGLALPAAIVWMRLSEYDLWLGFGLSVRLKEFALPVVGHPPIVRWLWGQLRSPTMVSLWKPSAALAAASFVWATVVLARLRHVIRTA